VSQSDSSRPSFTVRRNVALFAILGIASVGLSAACLVRGAGSLDTLLGVVFLLVGAVHLFAVVGARQPLLEADDEGVPGTDDARRDPEG
jgi:hypothetical protein